MEFFWMIKGVKVACEDEVVRMDRMWRKDGEEEERK